MAPTYMSNALTGISSMATRRVLAELCEAYRRTGGGEVRFESVGGVNATERVRAHEVFDLVVLAADAMDGLASQGHVIADSQCRIVESTVAIAVPSGAPHPAVDSEEALRDAVLAAPRIGYSTGPSASALMALFARWGLSDTLRDRLVRAAPGVPVAALLANGHADLGFQQVAELQDQMGIELIGSMPPGLEIVTTFVGGIGAGSIHQSEARAALNYMIASSTVELKRRCGMRESPVHFA